MLAVLLRGQLCYEGKDNLCLAGGLIGRDELKSKKHPALGSLFLTHLITRPVECYPGYKLLPSQGCLLCTTSMSGNWG